MREHALLPVGCDSTRPDYDYEQDLEIRWYLSAEEEEAQTEIVKQNGETAAVVHAVRKGNQVNVALKGQLPRLRFLVPGESEVQVFIEDI